MNNYRLIVIMGYIQLLQNKSDKKFWIEKEIQMAEFIIQAVNAEITPKAFIQALISAELDKKE